MEQKGLRGSAQARIDEQGRLKVPSIFRSVIQERHGADVFVTSLTGECVRIYPMPAWLEVEEKLSRLPSNHPALLKFLDHANYYGQSSELDGQGRIVISPLLRERAAIKGDVRVFGRIAYLEVWNGEHFESKLARNPWTDADGLALSQLGI
jgi:MraZ protein